MRLGLLCALLSVGLGCDAIKNLGAVHYCDLREATEPAHRCQEFKLKGPDIIVMRGTCESLGGGFGAGACDQEGVVGGCEDVDPSNPWATIEWYYATESIVTPEDVEAKCHDDGEVYVDPPA